MRTPLVLLLACATAACGADTPARDSLLAVVDTVNGVERLSYSADPATQLAWRFDTLAVIGGAMVEDENYQFETRGLTGNAEGDLFVADVQGKRILRYDRSGTFVRSYGREGAGPGELRYPMAVRLGPGDSIWVVDTGNNRVTIYDATDGGSRTLGSTQGGLPTNIALAGGHFYYVAGSVLATPAARADEQPAIPLVRAALDGAPLDTLWLIKPRPLYTLEFRSGNNLTMTMISMTFAPTLRWALLSDGRVVLSDSANYVLHIVTPDGTIERTIRRDPPARPVTEADREAAREEVRSQSGNPGLTGSPDFVRQWLEKMTFADVIPRITNLAVDSKDRIWVGVSVNEPEKTERIDVYDASGRLLGEIRDPAFFPRLFYGPDLAARVTTDEFDAEQVVVMRLVE